MRPISASLRGPSRLRDRRRRRLRGLASLAAVGVAAALGVALFEVAARPGADGMLGSGATTAPSTASPGEVGAFVGATATPVAARSAGGAIFPNGLLIADRQNDRLLVVDGSGHVLWRFPRPGALPAGQAFSADDAFIDPGLRTIVANDEFHEVIDRIDIATGRIVWQYGHYGVPGSRPGYLHTPDDAYPLANGDVVVADIENCRILEIAPDKTIDRQWGRTGDCRDAPPVAFARPNGDTPLPDGGLLVTEITGSRVVRLAPDGSVVFDVAVPVTYPSDAQLDANGDVVVADFSDPGQVVAVDPRSGAVVWRYGPASGPGRLDHPSLATPLPDGSVAINDDFRHRLVVIDPSTGAILWQYGHTDQPGTAAGFLDVPDGHEPLPPGIGWPAL